MTFEDMVRQSNERHAEAERLLDAALALPKPKLVMENGARKLLLSPGFDGSPYRITSFDEHGPIGHRDYGADDRRFMVDEIFHALVGDYTVRT
jgi:hypothetical protein